MSSRKKTRGRNIQSIVCPPTVKKFKNGKVVELPNPEAGKRKQIYHRPIPK